MVHKNSADRVCAALRALTSRSMLLPWLPGDIPISGAKLYRYTYRALLEADAWSPIGVNALLHRERAVQASGPREVMYHTAPNRPPDLPWLTPNAEPPVPLIDEHLGLRERKDFLDEAFKVPPLISFGRSGVRRWLQDPGKTLKLGHWAAMQSAAVDGLPSVVLSRSLAIAGLGVLGLQLQQRCAVCFRIAVPGLARCVYHSQSTRAVRAGGMTINRHRANARTAARVMQLLDDQGSPKDLEAAKRRRSRQVYGAVFGRPCGSVDAWALEVTEAIAASPYVSRLLPQDFDPASTVKAVQSLRSAIDQFERDPLEWPRKIVLAERWHHEERVIAPGKPPSGPRQQTIERLRQAAELEAQGVPPEEIAIRLGMTPRALTVMLKRARGN